MKKGKGDHLILSAIAKKCPYVVRKNARIVEVYGINPECANCRGLWHKPRMREFRITQAVTLVLTLVWC